MRTYLRRAEAANRLHVSTTTFKTLVAQGKIKYSLSPGGQKVYDPKEIDRFAAQAQGREPAEGVLVFYVRDSEGKCGPDAHAGGTVGTGVRRAGESVSRPRVRFE